MSYEIPERVIEAVAKTMNYRIGGAIHNQGGQAWDQESAGTKDWFREESLAVLQAALKEWGAETEQVRRGHFIKTVVDGGRVDAKRLITPWEPINKEKA